MADIGEAYVKYLEGKTAITDIVGTGTSARIYPDYLPLKPVLPAIVIYDSISGVSYENTTNGDGIAMRRFQVTCVADTKQGAEDLREEVRKVSSGFDHGTWGSGGSAVFVHGCSAAGFSGSAEPPKDGSDNWRFLRSIDLIVHHAETVANPT